MNSLLDAVTLVSTNTNLSSPPKKKNKKSKVEDIVWNEARTLALLSAVFKHKAHKKTDLTLMLKMKAVVKDLKSHALFDEYDREVFENVDSFDTKWKRFRKVVSKKFAMESEGANLSGLDDENVTEAEKLCISLIEDDLKTKASLVAAKEATLKKNQSMLSFEGAILKKVIIANPKEANQDYEGENDENESPNISSLSSNGGCGGSVSSMMTETDLFKIAQRERDVARAAKLELERDKFEADKEIEREKIRLESQRLAYDERKLELEEKRSSCMERMLQILLDQNSKK